MSERGTLADRLRALELRDTMISKQDPTTAVSTAPIAQLFNDCDRGISDLVTMMNSITKLLDDQRAAGIEAQVLNALQMDMKQIEMAALALKQPLAMIKAKHASVVQMQPMAPVGGPDAMMGMGPDPMMAASAQQAPMNMPSGPAPGGM